MVVLGRSMAVVPNLASLFPGQDVTAAGVAGAVLAAPADAGSLIDVTWTAPADNDVPEQDATERDVKWWCQPGKFPAAGDYAVLMTDSRGDAVAFVWATGAAP